MSSSSFVSEVFPDATKLFQEYAPWAWDRLFPSETEILCPIPTFTFFNFTFCWPRLAPACIVGCFIGIYGAYRCYKKSCSLGMFAWGCSFLSFGLMNISAWLCHSVFRHTSPMGWAISLVVDISLTSTSSFFIFLGSLVDAGKIDDRCLSTRVAALCYFPIVSILMWYCHMEKIPFASEFFYIFITLVAAITIVHVLVIIPIRRYGILPPEMLWFLLALVAPLCLISGPFLDRYLCYYLGDNLLTPVFYGCDLGFVGLIMYVFKAEQTRMNRHRLDKETKTHTD